MGWKDDLTELARDALNNAEDLADVALRRFARRMGMGEAAQIVAYSGFGNHENIWIRGRLLANNIGNTSEPDDTWWENLHASYQRWESDEIPNAAIRLQYGDQHQEVTTDKEGYYTACFSLEAGGPANTTVVASHRGEDRTLTALHQIYLLHPNAEFAVVSDVDDTIIHTHIYDYLQAAKLTFLNNSKSRTPLSGADQLYHSFSRGTGPVAVNPIFYLSNSPWNMYDLLSDFLDLNDFPAGPLLLRDIGFGDDASSHKIDTLDHLIDAHPNLPFILIGDSGQGDAEKYAKIAKAHPGRIKAIYIRDVDPGISSAHDEKVDTFISQANMHDVAFLRVKDSLEITRHAEVSGLVSVTI